MTDTIDYQAIETYALAEVAKHAPELEAAALVNTEKVITAFRNKMVSDYYLKPTTGYGYSDVGRDTLDLIYAEIFKTEAALVRSQFVSGTHALAVALLGNLRPGDELIGLTGTPYDTMQSIIGYPVKTKGSLVDLGITYKELPMSGEHVDLEAVKKAVTKNTKMVHIQRSCGYSSLRKTISVEEIGRIIAAAKEANPDVIAYVDNCYGEFIEQKEPTEVGADIMAGSLIKNLGGGLAPTGGYIVGFLFTALTMWAMERLPGNPALIAVASMVLGLIVCYAFGLVNAPLYAYLSWRWGYYGDMALNLYYLAMWTLFFVDGCYCSRLSRFF